MPELPDLVAYLRALEPRVLGRRLDGVRLGSPFLVRTAVPPLSDAFGREVEALNRLGKRLVFSLSGDLHLVLHLMIAGRLHWDAGPPKGAGKWGRSRLAVFDFETGSLTLTEASSKRRASLYLVGGRAGLAQFDRGGVEPLDGDAAAFAAVLRRENHTLKRSLTDPRLFSGIGNAYSDEILHRARLSPVRLTQRLTDTDIERLHGATQAVLSEWVILLTQQAGDEFPDRVTAFRPEMAVHGRYRQPCPVCGTAVQRIAYAENEANYCPTCQTEGKLLADRSLSRLLKGDWPRTIQELEDRLGSTGRAGGT